MKITLTNNKFAATGGCYSAKTGKRKVILVVSNLDAKLGIKPSLRTICQAFNDLATLKDKILIPEDCELVDETN